MAKFDHGGGCGCGLYAECEPDCEHNPKATQKSLSPEQIGYMNGLRYAMMLLDNEDDAYLKIFNEYVRMTTK